MRTVFADTAFWIALLTPSDQHHAQARECYSVGDFDRIVTTELVLIELLNFVSRQRPTVRDAVAAFTEGLRVEGIVNVIPHTSALFWDSVRLFREWRDKQWSLTDCGSFLVMKSAGITEALTSDQHFRQMGFRTLLAD